MHIIYDNMKHWQKGFSVEHYLNVLNIALRILNTEA